MERIVYGSHARRGVQLSARECQELEVLFLALPSWETADELDEQRRGELKL